MMKAKTQTAYFATAPSILAELKFIDFAVAVAVLERASETTVAIIKIKAATITLGKNPSTSYCKKSLMLLKPPKSSEGIRKTTTTNHFTTCPTKSPEFRFIPALLRVSSAPIDLKRLSTFKELKTCSRARATTLPKSQPIINNTTATINLGVNAIKLPHNCMRDALKTSPQ